jgi:hypothetical protein
MSTRRFAIKITKARQRKDCLAGKWRAVAPAATARKLQPLIGAR